ncbi:recombinase family protein [Nocardia sp. NBC_01009]|uniref:recombinase family protein n=1 Tax=Nocardia sp. NBC_01009 TaxID=2975996 RepID=UPI00386517E5
MKHRESETIVESHRRPRRHPPEIRSLRDIRLGPQPICDICGTQPDVSTLCGTVRGTARFGYARVSTRRQKDDSQIDALNAAGCERNWVDRASGKLAR